jgi:DNA topoisomerase I
MYIRDSKFGKFYGCMDYPNCKGTKPITTNIKCPKCGDGTLSEKYSPKSRKSFWGCTNYPNCNYISNYQPVDKKCSNCGHEYLEIKFRKNGTDWEKYLSCPGCKEKFEIID